MLSMAISIENTEFDINDYTLSDILLMDSEEFSYLLNNFERIYDPFNTYGTEYQATNIINGETAELQWTSGNADHSEEGTHELITAKACGYLLSEKGFWSSNHNAESEREALSPVSHSLLSACSRSMNCRNAISPR